jgi:hypothetical protein
MDSKYVERPVEGLRTRVRFPPAPPTNTNPIQLHRMGFVFVDGILRGTESASGTDAGRRRGFGEHARRRHSPSALHGATWLFSALSKKRFPPAPPINEYATQFYRVAYSFIDSSLRGLNLRPRGGESEMRDELLHRACLRAGEHLQVRTRPARAIPAGSTNKYKPHPASSDGVCIY